jgi:hypothetical protein
MTMLIQKNTSIRNFKTVGLVLISLSILIPSINFAQVDTLRFSPSEFAIYSTRSPLDSRFKFVKQCKVEFVFNKMSQFYTMKSNYLPKSLQLEIAQIRSKKLIELKFSNIVLISDSLHSSEIQCPPFTYRFNKKRRFWFYIGAGRIPWPIPSYN